MAAKIYGSITMTKLRLAYLAAELLPNPKPESVGPPKGREWWPRTNDVRATIIHDC